MAERHTEVGLSKRKRRLQWSNVNVQKVVVTLTFLFVPLFLLILFTYLPFFKMVQFSFYDMKYIGERKFVGLENYIDVFTRDDCFNALKLSLYYMVGSVVQLALALLFATILSFNPKGGSFFRGALYFPSLVCGIAVVHFQVFLYPRIRAGLHSGLAGNSRRHAAVLAERYPHQQLGAGGILHLAVHGTEHGIVYRRNRQCRQDAV
ncbi:MAG: carbohydrate ABC transporter permease [Ruminococcus sp.]